jgi:hypothetical protein
MKKPENLEHLRDIRDLRILTMLDNGSTQKDAGDANGVTRGHITKLIAQIRNCPWGL